MSTGINVEKANELKVSILDSVESLKKLSNRFESCYQIVEKNIDGYGKTSVVSDLRNVKYQLSIAISNVDSYISDINNVIRSYKRNDEMFGANIIRDIKKIEKK